MRGFCRIGMPGMRRSAVRSGPKCELTVPSETSSALTMAGSIQRVEAAVPGPRARMTAPRERAGTWESALRRGGTAWSALGAKGRGSAGFVEAGGGRVSSLSGRSPQGTAPGWGGLGRRNSRDAGGDDVFLYGKKRPFWHGALPAKRQGWLAGWCGRWRGLWLGPW
jgi:hypothetical protein